MNTITVIFNLQISLSLIFNFGYNNIINIESYIMNIVLEYSSI